MRRRNAVQRWFRIFLCVLSLSFFSAPAADASAVSGQEEESLSDREAGSYEAVGQGEESLGDQEEERERRQKEWEEQILAQMEDDEVDAMLQELFPEKHLSFRQVLGEVLEGNLELTADLILGVAKDQLTYVIRTGKEALGPILLLAVIAAIFTNFSRVFQSSQLSQISFYAAYLMMTALTLKTLQAVMDWTEEGIRTLTSFMGVFSPLFFAAVSVARGSVTAVAFYNLVLFSIYLTEVLIVGVALPMIHIYIVLRVLNDLSLDHYLTRAAELVFLVISWGLKTLLALVAGIHLVQGMISPAIDAVKRSIVTRGVQAIPGVGEIFGGMAEVAAGTAVLVKNGIGMTGALICVAVCLVPLFQMAFMTLLYKLAAAVIQPVSDPRITGLVETVGEGCRLLMRVIFTAGVLFLLTVAVVTAATGRI